MYTIRSTRWDIIAQNESGISGMSGIYRINMNCRPEKKDGLTVYDYKWFDFIAEPDPMYRIIKRSGINFNKDQYAFSSKQDRKPMKKPCLTVTAVSAYL